MHIKYLVVSGACSHAGEDRQVAGDLPVPADDEGTGGMLSQVVLVQKLVQRSEHLPVLHVMTVDKGIVVGEIRGAAAVKVNAPGQRVAAEGVGVQVLDIILRLHDGVVDVRAVHRQPCDHIVGYRRLLRVIALNGRLVLKDTLVKGMTVDIVVVVHTVDDDQEYQHKDNIDDTVIAAAYASPEPERRHLSVLSVLAPSLGIDNNDSAYNNKTYDSRTCYCKDNTGGDGAGSIVGVSNNGVHC